MQGDDALLDNIEDLVPDMKEEIYTRLTLYDLYLGSGTDILLFRAYKLRTKTLSAALVREALTLFPVAALQTVSRIAHRGYREWQDPPAGYDFQVLTNLMFEGAGSDRPFPHTRCIVDPDGRVLPYPRDVPGGANNVVFQARHAYVTSDRLGVVPGPPCMLRRANFLRICLCFDAMSAIEIYIYRHEGALGGRVLIYLNPTAIASYTALCGAILHIFFSLSSPLVNPPTMLTQSLLRVRLLRPRNLVPNAPLNFQPAIREALALVVLSLREPGVVPSSRLEVFNALQFHDCPLPLVLYN
jgi:hypothetical protein